MHVCSNQKFGVEFHMGGVSKQNLSEGKMGCYYTINVSGGLKIIDPKTQAKALLTKLVVWGLLLGEELWKDLL